MLSHQNRARKSFSSLPNIRLARFDVLWGVGQFATGAGANRSANGQGQSPASFGPAELLPNREPDRIWGGPSTGGSCAVCRTPLRPGELEMEIEFHRGGDSTDADRYHVHVRCYSAWHAEKDRLTQA